MIVAMLWRKPLICLVLAFVTTLHLDGGNAADSQAAARRPAVPGTGRLGSVKREAGTRIRRGSLWFRHDEHGAHTPSRGKMTKIMHPFFQTVQKKKKTKFLLFVCFLVK